MRVAHARASPHGQFLDLRRDAVGATGCEKVVEDGASDAKTARPGLERAIETIRAGDTLVVWRLDLGTQGNDLRRQHAEPYSRTPSADT